MRFIKRVIDWLCQLVLFIATAILIVVWSFSIGVYCTQHKAEVISWTVSLLLAAMLIRGFWITLNKIRCFP